MILKRGLGKGFGLIMIILLFSSLTLAQKEPYHLKLLAVQEEGDHYLGSDADLYLELNPGSGRVFLDTFPATKIDTQISTRFAKEIACQYFHLNCDQYDFIYTLQAQSNIIGGPSAGAAISALTAIALLNLKYNESVTITGTINSGGIIGPVGGLKEKLEAASKSGLKKVLIAQGSVIQPTLSPLFSSKFNSTNKTEINLTKYGRENLQLEVAEVLTLDEVLSQLTGLDFKIKEINITENSRYNEIMKGLQRVLCQRTIKIKDQFTSEGILISKDVGAEFNSKMQSMENSSQQGDYYSAASYCFSSTILLRSEYYKQTHLSLLELNDLFISLERKTDALEKKLNDEPIETIGDLQTLMIVKERIGDVKSQIKLFKTGNDSLENSYYGLAYAEERFFSAISWMRFFSLEGKKFIFNQEQLKKSCLQKISESDQQYQYVSLFMGDLILSHLQDKMAFYKKALEDKDYSLCLIIASQVKAEADAILSTMGLDNETIDPYLNAKKKAVEKVIAQNSNERMFPILGYSYYLYAQSFEDKDKINALIYLEYALEMSDLSIYFPEEKSYWQKLISVDLNQSWIYLVEGILLGAGITLLFFWLGKEFENKKKTNRKSRKRR